MFVIKMALSVLHLLQLLWLKMNTKQSNIVSHSFMIIKNLKTNRELYITKAYNFDGYIQL